MLGELGLTKLVAVTAPVRADVRFRAHEETAGAILALCRPHDDPRQRAECDAACHPLNRVAALRPLRVVTDAERRGVQRRSEVDDGLQRSPRLSVLVAV